MQPTLQVRALSKRYKGVQALAGVSLTVRQGEVFGFLGPNGAGKTTFTKCVTGFVRPDAGSVRLCGIDSLKYPAKAAQHVGLVPDQYDFYGHMTGREHLDFYARLNGLSKAQRAKRIPQVLDLVRMSDRADRKVKGYSHGMKQRICIAQAIINRPKLVILDEPTNGLDPQGAYELRQIMRRLAATGITIFLNSHQLSEVEQVCQRVAIVRDGRVLVVDEVDALRRRFGKASQARIRVLNPKPEYREAAAAIVETVEATNRGEYVFPATEFQTSQVVQALVAMGAKVAEVSHEHTSLEDVFLQLTGGS